MTERERDCFVTTLGAMAGAVISYLLFTDRGRALRQQIVPSFEELERELDQFKGTVSKSVSIASEGWRLLNDIVGDTSTTRRSMANPRQTVPF